MTFISTIRELHIDEEVYNERVLLMKWAFQVFRIGCDFFFFSENSLKFLYPAQVIWYHYVGAEAPVFWIFLKKKSDVFGCLAKFAS